MYVVTALYHWQWYRWVQVHTLCGCVRKCLIASWHEVAVSYWHCGSTCKHVEEKCPLHTWHCGCDGSGCSCAGTASGSQQMACTLHTTHCICFSYSEISNQLTSFQQRWHECCATRFQHPFKPSKSLSPTITTKWPCKLPMEKHYCQLMKLKCDDRFWKTCCSC